MPKDKKVNKLMTRYWLSRQYVHTKWKTFEHNGVLFPPLYKPHKVPIIYNNQRIILPPLAEEYATLFAKYKEHEYFNNKVFRKNFWNDWSKVLKDTPIKSLDDCDFSLIYNYLLEQKEQKKIINPEEKKAKEEDEKKYKVAYVDGKEQEVGNFRIEPPSIFIGRGCHPKLGSIKKRIMPEDITINIGKNAKIPVPPYGKWKNVIHDNNVRWLASWLDTINDKTKYVFLGSRSDWKAESDKNKFDFARKLKKNIKRIRENNDINMSSPEEKIRQIAVALYFIDKLALRVGNEKGEDEADTVGVTSLRCEHIHLLENNTVKLDFLGKDSIRYTNKLQVTELVYKNIKGFLNNKTKNDDLFDRINSNDLNKYLNDFLDGLTAKVFRTYNASHLLQKELNKITKKYNDIPDIDKTNKLYDGFNKANAAVALLCNHQKKVSKTFNEQINKITQMINKNRKEIKKIQASSEELTQAKKERIKKLQKKILELKAKKNLKIDLKGVSLDTSKTNYLDPRITIAFAKKHNLSLDKLFSKKLQDKFFWAMDVSADFKF
ncbi:DNA topoisomerase IB [Hokovirus HKV1]|uniref:DNA topoisomerase 1 n=1 Tax=Hokovirus HKV1 TaxID=1977638 RepID=A0A1V0SEU3_9VIRU|nr:DNA topoisomerase IB [Hokovirus HKV1]